MGINDYELKFRAIQSILNANTARDVFTKIEKAAGKKSLHVNAKSVYEAAHKWKKKTKPGATHRHFFTVLLEEIDANNLDKDSFVNCSYAEFFQSLPERNKRKIDKYDSEKKQDIKNIYDEKK